MKMLEKESVDIVVAYYFVDYGFWFYYLCNNTFQQV